jgi:hypothetical protein
MKNVEAQVKGDKLVITVDLKIDLGPSKSGKTQMIATSEGNIRIPGRDEFVGLNVYRQK